jgi:hypothetical protein
LRYTGNGVLWIGLQNKRLGDDSFKLPKLLFPTTNCHVFKKAMNSFQVNWQQFYQVENATDGD